MTGALAAVGLMGTTIPMIVASGAIIKTTQATFTRNGRPVGRLHYHYKGKKIISHRHEGGQVSHYHRGLRGYGRTRKSLRR